MKCLRSPPSGEAVYFDVFGRAIVRWKAASLVSVCCGAWMVLLIEIAIVIRKFGVGFWAIALAKVGWLVAILISGGLGYVLFKLLRVAHRFPPESANYPWIAHPLPAQIAFFALGFVGVGIVALLAAKRAGFWGFWIANCAYYLRRWESCGEVCDRGLLRVCDSGAWRGRCGDSGDCWRRRIRRGIGNLRRFCRRC